MISFVSQAQNGSSSVTLPSSISAGDYIVVFSYRNTTTAPTLVSGYTNITSGSGNANAYRVQYKIAVGTESGVSITATNASIVQVGVYRGVARIGSSAGATNAAASNTTAPAISTMIDAYNTSWVLRLIGSKGTSQGVPSGLVQRGTSQTATTSIAALFDTDSTVSSAGSTTSTNSGSVTGSGITVELVALLPTAQRTESFTSATDANIWGTFLSANGTIAATGGTLQISLTGSDADYTGISTDDFRPYDLTSSYVSVQIVAQGTQTWASKEVEIHCNKLADGANDLFYVIGDGNGTTDKLTAFKKTSGSNVQIAQTTYNSTTMKYLRIRESTGTIYWDYSADSSSWTPFGSVANPFAVTGMQIQLDAGNYSSETGTTTVQFDNLSIVSGSVPTNLFFAAVRP